VEHPARPVAFGVVGELRPQPSVRLNLPADETVEPRESHRLYGPAVRERAADDARLRSVEHFGHVFGVADARVTFVQLRGDIHEFDLPADLVADEVVDVVQTLDALQFDTRAVGD